MQKLTRMPGIMDRCPATIKRLRVAAYCRVSTRQEEQDSSIEQQERYYEQYISRNPNWTNAGVFSERVSGLNMKGRTEFQALMKLCRRRKIDLILVKSFSRLGWNTLDMLRALRKLRDLGVDVYFEEENLWLHDERRMEILITVFCALAQSESENISQNIRWGVRQGFRMGTSGYADFVCYGYKRGDDGRLAIDEPDAEIVRRIFQMRAEGKSLGAISDWLYDRNIHSPTGIVSSCPPERKHLICSNWVLLVADDGKSILIWHDTRLQKPMAFGGCPLPQLTNTAVPWYNKTPK